MDWLVQKAVELGVTAITPVLCTRGEAKIPKERIPSRLAHWQGVIISASEQRGRNRLAKMSQPINLDQWLQQCQADVKLLAAPEGVAMTADLQKSQQSTRFSMLVGPEGGLTDAEVASAKAQQFMPIQLGPRILRVETAGLASVLMLQLLFGDISRESSYARESANN